MFRISMIILIIFSGCRFVLAESPGRTSMIFLNRILAGNELSYDKDIGRIASGKILLVDDPANYAIYETLEKHIRAFSRDMENQADLVSFYNYQESILGDIGDILQ